MAYKPAKDQFTKDEIAAILRQNLVLYREEPEFVDYFVNLGLYLIDQAYCSTGARSTGLDQVLAAYEQLKNQSGASYGPTQLAKVLAIHRNEESEIDELPLRRGGDELSPPQQSRHAAKRTPTPSPPPPARPPSGDSGSARSLPRERPRLLPPPDSEVSEPAPRPVPNLWEKFEPAIPTPPRPEEESSRGPVDETEEPAAIPAEIDPVVPSEEDQPVSARPATPREESEAHEEPPAKVRTPPPTPEPEDAREEAEDSPAVEEVVPEPPSDEDELDEPESEEGKPEIKLVRPPLPRFTKRDDTRSDTGTQHPFSPARKKSS